jgi:hypothetical protein
VATPPEHSPPYRLVLWLGGVGIRWWPAAFPYRGGRASAHLGLARLPGVDLAQELSLAAMVYLRDQTIPTTPPADRLVVRLLKRCGTRGISALRWRGWVNGCVLLRAPVRAGIYRDRARRCSSGYDAIALRDALPRVPRAGLAQKGARRIEDPACNGSSPRLGTIHGRFRVAARGASNASGGSTRIAVRRLAAVFLKRRGPARESALFVYAAHAPPIFDFGLRGQPHGSSFAIVGAHPARRVPGREPLSSPGYPALPTIEIKTLVLSAILAAAVYLSFTSLKKVVETVSSTAAVQPLGRARGRPEALRRPRRSWCRGASRNAISRR